MIDTASIEANLKEMTKGLSIAGAKDFEKTWEEFLKKPELQQVAFMKKIFETFYVHAYVQGGSDALVEMLSAIERQRSCQS